jgi:hypothetical protein
VATWTTGLEGWSTTAGWRVAGGALVNDGSTDAGRAQPDFQPLTPDYSVASDIELVRDGACFWFALEARLSNERGYRAGVGNRPPNGGFCGATTVRLWDGADTFLEKPFVATPGVHHYDLSVLGTEVRFLVDGSVKLQTQSTLYGEAGSAALWSSNAEIIVRSFEATDIPTATQ